MIELWLLFLGLQHGLQPDHAAAAMGLAARSRTPAWRAALRVSVGHVGALALAAVAIGRLPAPLLAKLEPIAGIAAGTALSGLGLALLLQLWRSQYVVHRHRHAHGGETHEHLHAHPLTALEAHEHRHARGALALGLVLGLGSARTLAALLPAMAGPGRAMVGLVAYGGGLVLGVVLATTVLELLRKQAESRRQGRWADLVVGGGSLLAGGHLMLATLG